MYRWELCSLQRSVGRKCAVSSWHFEVCSVQSALCSVQSGLCNVEGAVCSVQYAVCSIQYEVCSLMCSRPGRRGRHDTLQGSASQSKGPGGLWSEVPCARMTGKCTAKDIVQCTVKYAVKCELKVYSRVYSEVYSGVYSEVYNKVFSVVYHCSIVVYINVIQEQNICSS